jgi:hypothetical protein
MGTLTKLWAGRVYGTNTGNLFLTFDETGPRLSGTLRFRDTDLGVAAYRLEGIFEDAIELTGSPIETREGVELGQIRVTARLTPEGQLRGEWLSTIGTAGTFVAYPHSQEATSQETSTQEQIPEQFYTHSIVLGAVSLYAQDVRTLISDVRKDFTAGRPITTYSTGGPEVTKYAEDFLAEMPDLGTLSYLKIHIQEPDAHGINRIVVVELRAFGINEIRAQGVNESWVIGKAEAIAGLLRRHQNSLITTYRKFGLNLNQLIFLAMLVAIPEITSLGSRALFVAVVFLLLTSLLWVHSRFIPNATIRLTGSPPTALARVWPTIVSWLFAVIASLVAAYLYTWLTAKAP